jgi:hypothetical protein
MKMNDDPCGTPETFKRDLELFVEMVETSILSSRYGGVGKLDGDPFGPGIIDMLERYDALPLYEKQESASDIAYLMEVQQEFGE